MSAKEHIETEKRAADLMLAIELEEEEKKVEEKEGVEEEDDKRSEVTEDVRSHVALTVKTDYTVKMDYASKVRSIDSDDEEEEEEEDDDMREFTEGMMDITLEDEEEDEDNELGDRGMTFLPHFQSTGQGLPIWMPLAVVPTTNQIDEGGGGGEEEGNRVRERESGMADRDPRSARVDSAKGKYGPDTCTAPL